MRSELFTAPPQRNILVLGLLSSRVKDALPAVDFHTDIQLKVDVSFRRWATEAAVGRSAWPALTEQLTHSRKARGLSLRRLAENQGGQHRLVNAEN